MKIACLVFMLRSIYTLKYIYINIAVFSIDFLLSQTHATYRGLFSIVITFRSNGYVDSSGPEVWLFLLPLLFVDGSPTSTVSLRLSISSLMRVEGVRYRNPFSTRVVLCINHNVSC